MKTYLLMATKEVNKKEVKRKMLNVRGLTHYNPYLVNLYTKHEQQNFSTMASAYTRSHLESIFISSKIYKHLEKSRDTFIRDLYKWALVCDNHITCDYEEHDKFIESFPYQVGLFYFRKPNKQQFTVHCTFPCLFTLINEILSASLSQDQIMSIPIVQRFLYEDHFFTDFTSTMRLVVLTADGNAKYLFTGLLKAESGLSLEVGPLYHLRYTYPVIDGVGYARLEGDKVALIFVQVSLSKYTKHAAKVSNLLEHAPENKSLTNLQYYKNLKTNIEKVLYVYVSPHCYSTSEKFSKRSTEEVEYTEIQHLW